MVGQGMMHRFQDLRTQSKLLVSFGLVSVIIMVMATAGIATLRQLSSQSQTVYLEYTVPLAQFSDLGTALTRHHQILLDMAQATKHDDFLGELARLEPLKQSIQKHVAEYKSTTLRVSRSGRARSARSPASSPGSCAGSIPCRPAAMPARARPR